MACFSSSTPPVGVYFVKFASMAAIPAFLMLSGVGKSGSPAPKSTTSAPSRRRRSASAATFIVDDTLISEILDASSCTVCIRYSFFLLSTTRQRPALHSLPDRGRHQARDDQPVHQFAAARNQIQMPVGDRVKGTGIDGDSPGWRRVQALSSMRRVKDSF